jgi:DNA-binding IclR family transcriptional regulator
MRHIRIVVANEPRVYREAIGSALEELRPNTQVLTTSPDELDREVLQFSPHIVVCSELTDTTRVHAVTWIVLYPRGTSQVVVSVDGDQTHATDLVVDNLLEIVDRTTALVSAR